MAIGLVALVTSSVYLSLWSGLNGRIPIGVNASARRWAPIIGTDEGTEYGEQCAGCGPTRTHTDGEAGNSENGRNEHHEPDGVRWSPVTNERYALIPVGDHRATDDNRAAKYRDLTDAEGGENEPERRIHGERRAIVPRAVHTLR